MNRETNNPITDRYGTVRDIRIVIDDLSKEESALLKEIVELLNKLDLRVQTGQLRDNENDEILRYIFTGSDILKVDDTVRYTPVNNGGKFRAIVVRKEVNATNKSYDQ